MDAVRRKRPALIAPKRGAGLVEVVTEFNRGRLLWDLRRDHDIYYQDASGSNAAPAVSAESRRQREH
jgi:hypothetical protein